MLAKPLLCSGCPLEERSIGFMRPQLAEQPYGVTLIGEALGANEAELGAPFVGKAGFRLSRLIEWAGLERKRFDILNCVWCQPPLNRLEGEEYEHSSIAHCRDAHWGGLLERSRVLVPMGNVATSALLGRKGILSLRGYVRSVGGQYILPTVHPSFIQRGQARWSAAFIHDLQKAVTISQGGVPSIPVEYTLDPLPFEALAWAEEAASYLASHPTTYLAFDIETPGKPEEEDEADADLDWKIDRIGFAYQHHHALSIPWEPAYLLAIITLLATSNPKVVWNAGFDVPRVRRMGVGVRGVIHDGMIAWHILHSDLPKRLGFVATFTCPFQEEWKHLSRANPAFYNATDADVELQSMDVIERELRRVGLWGVYQRDVIDLEPILAHLHLAGMPLDPAIREDRAAQLAQRQDDVRRRLEMCIPLTARRIEHVYINTPKETAGLYTRASTRLVRRCASCGAEKPRKDHFKRFKRKENPCAEAGAIRAEEAVTEYYRLTQFSPSREQLVEYHRALKRSLPTAWDKRQGKRRVSFGEKQLTESLLRYPDDPVYPLVLDYRSLDKIAGTYIGRPA